MISTLLRMQVLVFVTLVASCLNPRPHPISTVINSPDPERAATGTPEALSASAPGWTTFVSDLGVAIEHPPDSSVRADNDTVVFVSPSGSEIFLGVYPRPIEDRGLADPNEWYEGDYEIRWSRPVSMPDAVGTLLVWAGPREDGRHSPPQLIAVFNSEQKELDIRLWAYFAEEAMGAADPEDFEQVVSLQFADFLRILSSIRIRP